MRRIAIAAALGFGALGLLSPPSADAAGCLKGAILGGIAGHYAGHHGLLGAGAGCFLGHELSNRSTRSPQSGTTLNANNLTVTRDQSGNRIVRDQNGMIVARGTPVTVQDQYGNLMTKYRYTTTTTGYGSSTPQRLQ